MVLYVGGVAAPRVENGFGARTYKIVVFANRGAAARCYSFEFIECSVTKCQCSNEAVCELTPRGCLQFVVHSFTHVCVCVAGLHVSLCCALLCYYVQVRQEQYRTQIKTENKVLQKATQARERALGKVRPHANSAFSCFKTELLSVFCAVLFYLPSHALVAGLLVRLLLAIVLVIRVSVQE